MGFKLNDYDPCVANKVIDGKQCTIGWYVNDNKISHVDPKVNDEIVRKIEERFGKMTVTRGKEHVFLGMKINFNDNGTASINMKEYLKEAIVAFWEDITTSPLRRQPKGTFLTSTKRVRR
jgi:predicted metal-dependent peptidase